ncbi:MAG: tetratricopeptide repeat protein [SAR324 cluster bacterium]|nr:tetratricopeptide repeat protein [SAR324 cluster bacterium]
MTAVIITGVWGGLATYWSYPQIKDQLFIQEKEKNYAEASSLLVKMLDEGMLASSPERIEQLAQTYLSAGETEKVEALYNNHNLPDSYFRKIIESYREKRDQPNLLRMLLIQQKRTPENPKLREEIAQLHQWLKNDEAAIQQLQKGIQQFPEQYELYEPLAQIYFRLNQEDQAFAVYQQRAQQFNRAELWEELSDAYLWKKNAKLAEEALLQAVALELSLKNLVRLGQFYLSQNRNKIAVSTYLRAVRFFEQKSEWSDSEKLLALQSYDFLKLNDKSAALLPSLPLSSIPEDRLTFYFYLAIRAEVPETVNALFDRLSKNPPENFARIDLDYALFSRNPQKLQGILEKLAEAGKSKQADWEQLAALAFETRQPQIVRTILQNGRLPVFFWKELGNHYFEHEQTEKGLEAHILYARKANTIETWRELINLHFFKNRDQEALNLFRREIAERYNQGPLWKELAELYFWKQNFPEGENALKRAIQMSPQLEWMILLAQHFENRQNLSSAEEWYQKAISQHTNQKEGNFNLVRFYIRNNMAPKASPIMRKIQSDAALQGHPLSIEEKLEAIQIFRFSRQSEWALETLSELPPEELPKSSLPDFFNLAFYEKKFSLARVILIEWGKKPHSPYWEKVLEFASQVPLSPDLETGLLEFVENSKNLKSVQQLAQYFENTKRMSEAEQLYKQAIILSKNLKTSQLDLAGFYIRNNFLEKAVPVMRSVQQQNQLSVQEKLNALDLYSWTSQTSHALSTLKTIPTSELPLSKLPIYFDLAFFGGNYPLAETILNEWGKNPSTHYWQKVLAFSSQSNLDPSLENALRTVVEESKNLQWIQELAGYYENNKRLSDAEHFYKMALAFNDGKANQLALANFYIRNSLLDKAVPAVIRAQQQYTFSLQEKLDSLDLFLWTNQNKLALKTLSQIPLENLPQSKIPNYFDLAFFARDYPMAHSLLKEWSKSPSQQYWQKMLDLALQTPLEPEFEKLLRRKVEKSGNSLWYRQLAQYYEKANQLTDAEYFYQMTADSQNKKESLLALAKFYIRNSQLNKAVPVMITVQSQFKLTFQEQLEALDLFIWTSRSEEALKTLSAIPPERISQEKLPVCFDIAFFGKNIPLSKKILKEWGKTPSQVYWEKVLLFSRLSPLDEEQEKGLRIFVRTAKNLEWTRELAQSYESQNQNEKAEEYFQLAASLNPDLKAGKWELVQFYLRAGKLLQAVPIMQNLQKSYDLTSTEQMQALSLYLWTTQLDPAVATLPKVPLQELPQENLNTYFDLAVFGGDLERAEDILTRWSQNPFPPFKKKRLAFAIMRGQTDEALTIVSQEIKEQGETIDLLEQLYQIFASDQNQQGQISTIEKILQRVPDNPDWLNRAINYYRFHQKYDRASSFLTQLFERNPLPAIRKPLIWALLANRSEIEAKRLLLETPKDEWDNEFEQLALDIGYALEDLPLVAENLQKRYQRQHDLEDLTALVALFGVMKELSLELRYSEELFRVRPDFDNHSHYIDVLFRARKTKLANRELTKLAKKARSFEEIKIIAELAENRKDPTLALNSYHRLLEWEPDAQEILKNFGRFLADHEKYPEAIAVMERYLRLEPEDLEVLHRIALLYPVSGLIEKQSLFFEKLVNRFQSKKDLQLIEKQLFASGLAYTGNPKKAVKIYRQILKETSGDIQVFEQFTGLLFQIKEYETLLTELKNPLSETLDKEQFFLFKSSAQKALDRKTEAIQTLKNWVQSSPRNEQAWIDLAYSYLAIRNYNLAEKAFQQARGIAEEKIRQ